MGHIVRNEQAQSDNSGPGGHNSIRKHSEPRRSTDEAVADYQEKLKSRGYQ